MIINLVLTFAIPNISVAGHIGGLVMGIALFKVIAPKRPYIYEKMIEMRQGTGKQHVCYGLNRVT